MYRCENCGEVFDEDTAGYEDESFSVAYGNGFVLKAESRMVCPSCGDEDYLVCHREDGVSAEERILSLLWKLNSYRGAIEEVFGEEAVEGSYLAAVQEELLDWFGEENGGLDKETRERLINLKSEYLSGRLLERLREREKR